MNRALDGPLRKEYSRKKHLPKGATEKGTVEKKVPDSELNGELNLINELSLSELNLAFNKAIDVEHNELVPVSQLLAVEVI